jgi:hypothetical protein
MNPFAPSVETDGKKGNWLCRMFFLPSVSTDGTGMQIKNSITNKTKQDE